MQENLLSATEFAKLCGVSAQTILNWIKSGDIEPAFVHGRYCFFSRDSYYGVHVRMNAPSRPIASCALVFGSDDEMKAGMERFLDVITENYPNARRISWLTEELDSIVDGKYMRTNSNLLKSVISDAHKCYHTELLHLASEIIDQNELLHDESLFNVVNIAFNASDINFSGIESIEKDMEQLYLSIVNKFGIRTLLTRCGYGAESLFNNSVHLDVLEKNCAGVEESNALARSIGVRGNAKGIKSGVKELFRQGYYSVVKCGYSMVDDMVSYIGNAIVSNYYNSVYIDDFSRLPSQFVSFLSVLSQSGAIELYGDVKNF